MKLSEAMMLASTVKAAVRDNDWNVCALGVSADVAGVPSEREFMLFGQKITINERPMTIEKEWPWLGSYHDGDDDYIEDISDKFEHNGYTVAELAEYVASIEPSCGDCNRFDCTCKPEAVTDSEQVAHI